MSLFLLVVRHRNRSEMLRWDHPPFVTCSEIFLKKMRGYGKIRKIMEVTMNMSNHCSTHYRYCSITQSFFDDSQKMDENLLEYDCLWKSDLENGKVSGKSSLLCLHMMKVRLSGMIYCC